MTKQDYVSVNDLDLRYPYVYPSDVDGKEITITLEVVSKDEYVNGEWGVMQVILKPTRDENLVMATQRFGTYFRKTGRIVWYLDREFSNDRYYAYRNEINDRIDMGLRTKGLYFIRVTMQPKRGKKIVRSFELSKNKPKKMESNKMYHKKSQTKKSPVKRMTGNIEVLGKNFRKLI